MCAVSFALIAVDLFIGGGSLFAKDVRNQLRSNSIFDTLFTFLAMEQIGEKKTEASFLSFANGCSWTFQFSLVRFRDSSHGAG